MAFPWEYRWASIATGREWGRLRVAASGGESGLRGRVRRGGREGGRGSGGWNSVITAAKGRLGGGT